MLNFDGNVKASFTRTVNVTVFMSVAFNLFKLALHVNSTIGLH